MRRTIPNLTRAKEGPNKTGEFSTVRSAPVGIFRNL